MWLYPIFLCRLISLICDIGPMAHSSGLVITWITGPNFISCLVWWESQLQKRPLTSRTTYSPSLEFPGFSSQIMAGNLWMKSFIALSRSGQAKSQFVNGRPRNPKSKALLSRATTWLKSFLVLACTNRREMISQPGLNGYHSFNVSLEGDSL